MISNQSLKLAKKILCERIRSSCRIGSHWRHFASLAIRGLIVVFLCKSIWLKGCLWVSMILASVCIGRGGVHFWWPLQLRWFKVWLSFKTFWLAIVQSMEVGVDPIILLNMKLSILCCFFPWCPRTWFGEAPGGSHKVAPSHTGRAWIGEKLWEMDYKFCIIRNCKGCSNECQFWVCDCWWIIRVLPEKTMVLLLMCSLPRKIAHLWWT